MDLKFELNSIEVIHYILGIEFKIELAYGPEIVGILIQSNWST